MPIDDITHRCAEGEKQFIARRTWPPVRRGEFRRYRVDIFESTDGGRSWIDIPMKLAVASRVTRGLFATWPPESIDVLSCASGVLMIEFRDHWIPYERPVLPFRLDQESLWRATYDRERRRWKLKRLRHLDYEGSDKPIYGRPIQDRAV